MYKTDDKYWSTHPNQINMTPNKIIQQQKEVEAFLAQCGLSQYFQVFMEEGFERMESVNIIHVYICYWLYIIVDGNNWIGSCTNASKKRT